MGAWWLKPYRVYLSPLCCCRRSCPPHLVDCRLHQQLCNPFVVVPNSAVQPVCSQDCNAGSLRLVQQAQVQRRRQRRRVGMPHPTAAGPKIQIGPHSVLFRLAGRASAARKRVLVAAPFLVVWLFCVMAPRIAFKRPLTQHNAPARARVRSGRKAVPPLLNQGPLLSKGEVIEFSSR